MKEDILEQLVDDYLQAKGYFTQHNLKYRPHIDHHEYTSNKDSNHSDIDVLGFHPGKQGPERVIAVSCKSSQAGFKVTAKIDELMNNKKIGGRKAWKSFRELMQPKWAEAFIDTVESATGTRIFTYVTAVTKIKGNNKHAWESHEPFIQLMGGNPIQILTLREMMATIVTKITKTVAGSHFSRTIQLLKASGLITSP